MENDVQFVRAALFVQAGSVAFAVAHLITPDELESLEGREPMSEYWEAQIATTLDSPHNGRTVRVACSVHFDEPPPPPGGMPSAR